MPVVCGGIFFGASGFLSASVLQLREQHNRVGVHVGLHCTRSSYKRCFYMVPVPLHLLS